MQPSGQAAAKAMRTRWRFVMRPAILSRRIRRVVNSAVEGGCGLAMASQHQPVDGGMQHETHLIGECRAATGAVGGKLTLVQLDQVLGQLDQVLGLIARAAQRVV
jgi:hypothetical protein